MAMLTVKPGKARGCPADPGADDLVAKARRFADLSAYPLKKRLMIRAAGLAFYGLINLIGRTVRFKVEGMENWDNALRDGYAPIVVFWHDGIFLATYFGRGRGGVVITSQSVDGEYIARCIQRFGYGAVRGSSTRGGVGAFVEMIRLIRLGQPAVFTIDGPRGPRHIAKPGAVLLAKKTGQPIISLTTTPARFWTVSRSWDATRIPKPFTRARVEVTPPIFVPPDADESVLETKRGELQETLDAGHRRGEEWRAAQ
jgi:lysophospholipid acyltransferase (LPLAT)-like uncharacterized protein